MIDVLITTCTHLFFGFSKTSRTSEMETITDILEATWLSIELNKLYRTSQIGTFHKEDKTTQYSMIVVARDSTDVF